MQSVPHTLYEGSAASLVFAWLVRLKTDSIILSQCMQIKFNAWLLSYHERERESLSSMQLAFLYLNYLWLKILFDFNYIILMVMRMCMAGSVLETEMWKER